MSDSSKNRRQDVDSNQIPSYFAYQRYESDNAVQIIATDLSLEQEMLGAEKDVTIQADVLCIEKSIENPGKNLTINARELHVASDAVLSTTGPEPKDNYKPGDRAQDGQGYDDDGNGHDGQPGNEGSPGSNAGNLLLLTGHQNGTVNCTADGGAGGRGQDGGNGARGKDGDAGDDAVIQKGLQTDHVTKVAQPGGHGGNGGDGGPAGISGNGGHGGSIVAAVMDAPPAIKGSVDGGAVADAVGKEGAGGGFGRGGEGGRKAKCNSRYVAETVITVCELTDDRAPSGAEGTKGLDGSPGRKGQPGGKGEIETLTGPPATQMIINTSSLEQRQLTYHLGKLTYLDGQYDAARTIFQWLVTVCPDLDDSETPDSDSVAWTQLKKQAQLELARLAQGLDYFGFPLNHVPLVSLQYYKDTLDAMLLLGGQIEQTYNQYLDEVNDQEKQEAALKNSLQQLDHDLKDLDAQLQQTIQDITASQKDIASYDTKIADQRIVVNHAQDSFKDAVEKHFECSFADVLTFVTSLILLGTDAFAAVSEIGSLVGDLSKEAVEFEKVIKRIETVTKDIQDMQKKWQDLQKVITPDNPDAGKLVMDKDEFDKMMQDFVDEYPVAKEYKEQVDAYLDLIQARNQCLLKYNALMLQRMSLEAKEEADKNQELRVRNLLAEQHDPTLAPMRAFMQQLYTGDKERILMYLFQEHQAYNYWALANKPFDVADNSIAELSEYHTRIHSSIIELMNQAGHSGPRQKFNNITIELKPDDFNYEFEQFRQTGKLSFTIPMAEPGFSGFAHVIATNFTAEIQNVSTSNNRIYVRLKHNGIAQFFNVDGDYYLFSHDPIPAFYVYEPTGKVIAGGNLGGHNDSYIGLSPFTNWSLELPSDPKFNPDLDCSSVTGITLTFSGTCQGYTKEGRKKVQKRF